MATTVGLGLRVNPSPAPVFESPQLTLPPIDSHNMAAA